MGHGDITADAFDWIKYGTDWLEDILLLSTVLGWPRFRKYILIILNKVTLMNLSFLKLSSAGEIHIPAHVLR